VETAELSRSEAIAKERVENGQRMMAVGKFHTAAENFLRAVKEMPGSLEYYKLLREAMVEVNREAIQFGQAKTTGWTGKEAERIVERLERASADGNLEQEYYLALSSMDRELMPAAAMRWVVASAEAMGYTEIAEYERSFWPS